MRWEEWMSLHEHDKEGLLYRVESWYICKPDSRVPLRVEIMDGEASVSARCKMKLEDTHKAAKSASNRVDSGHA